LTRDHLDIKWVALYTAPRAEKKVCSRLRDKGYNVYLPLITTVRQWSDRKKKVETPLISSYVFIQIAHDDLPVVKQEIGVVGVLNYLGKPAVIKAYEIENLKILLAEQNSIQIYQGETLKKGEPIQVVKGAMMGLIGELVRYQNKTRVIVNVNACAVAIEVNIPLSFVERIT